MTLSRDEIRKLLGLLDITEVEEIDCEEFMHRAAGYVERLGPDGVPPPGYERIVHHLRICPECREEFEELWRVMREASE